MSGNKGLMLSGSPRHALNAICPYFTMFPLEFPLRILERRARHARVVHDPFCGRGTTLYAARQKGRRAIGLDCSPVAVAISQAKLASVSVKKSVALARLFLGDISEVTQPEGIFWRTAFHAETLRDVCRVRSGLLETRNTDAAVILRAVMLGILHGPKTRIGSYLSNQMQRTFSPKPDYAVRFWNSRKLEPTKVDVLAAIERKLKRIARGKYRIGTDGWQDVHLGDSSDEASYSAVLSGIDAVITSPPYYGMRTYVSDQWLRHWFLGGPDCVDYADPGYLPASSLADFVAGLGRTWANVAEKAGETLRLFVRFGAIPSRAIDARSVLLQSLDASGVGWRIVSIRGALDASAGRRQVRQMRKHDAPIEEIDLHAVLS